MLLLLLLLLLRFQHTPLALLLQHWPRFQRVGGLLGC
jgi:uncharacterized membrane protein YdcZ (DUF606 family)